MVCAGYEDFDFRSVYQTLFNFMTVELSAFYFDIRRMRYIGDPMTAQHDGATPLWT